MTKKTAPETKVEPTDEEKAKIAEKAAEVAKPAEKKSIVDRIFRASDLKNYNRIKGLFMGPSGGGKSELAAKFPKPLIGLTERQAIPTIIGVNPDAKIFMIETVENIEEFLAIASSPKLVSKGIESIVVDSLTDIQRILKDGYTAKQTKRTDITDQDTWGVIIDKTARFARVVRDAIANVAVIVIDQEIAMDVGIVHRPAVSGKKLPNELQQYFNCVGFVRKDMADDGKIHSVVFDDGPNYSTKSMKGLDAIEPPEPEWFLHKVFGADLSEEVKNRVDEWNRRRQSVKTEQTTSGNDGGGAFE